MRNEYEMVTVKAYVDSLDEVKYNTVSEQEIANEVEKYLLNIRRADTNAKIVESLLAQVYCYSVKSFQYFKYSIRVYVTLNQSLK